MSVPDEDSGHGAAGDGAGETHPLRAPHGDRGARCRRADRDRRRGRDRRARRRRIEPRYRRQRRRDRGHENRGAVAVVADAGERDARLRRPDDDRRTGRDGAVESATGAANRRDRSGDAAERAGHPRLRHRDAGPAAGRVGGGAGEGGGRLPGEQRGREPIDRRRLGGRRLRIDAVRKRRADGVDRRAERDAGGGQGHGRPEPGLVGRARARRRPERACGRRVVRVCLRPELGLHRAAGGREDRQARRRACTRSAASRSCSSTVRSPRGGRSCPGCQRDATSAS